MVADRVQAERRQGHSEVLVESAEGPGCSLKDLDENLDCLVA